MTATTVDARSAQMAAIEASGWGRPFRIFQPRNLASWVFLLYLFYGAVAAVRWFRPNVEALTVAAIGGSTLFAIYLFLWLWFLRSLDRWTRLPAKLLLAGFLWGGLTATFFIALPANTALLSIYNKAGSATFAQDWGPPLAAPFTEETGKGIGILLLIFIAPRLIRSPFDGFILGAFVGLGFQISEDLLYVLNEARHRFGDDQIGAVINIFAVRGVAGVVSHALFSAIYGTALIYLVGTPAFRPRRVLGIALIVTAMVFHGVWDGMAALGGELGVPAPLLMVPFAVVEIVALTMIARRVSRGERAWMRDLLAPEVDRGTITTPELDALSASGKERKRFVKHATGYTSRKTAGHVLDSAADLAESIARSRGVETDETRLARSEVARLRLS